MTVIRWLFPLALLMSAWPASADVRPGTKPGRTFFAPAVEAREQAFTVQVPQGWTTEGGVYRTDPQKRGGSLNAISAKCDFTVKRDAAGTVALRLLPEMVYFDSRRSPVATLFPPGSNYNGATVAPKPLAIDYLEQTLLPKTHPKAENVQILDRRPLPELTRKMTEAARFNAVFGQFRYDSAALSVLYTEGGVSYREVLVAVIEDWGQLGGGLWTNKETGYFRAPAAEFDRWAPLGAVIRSSFKLNLDWLRKEMRGQMQRGDIAYRTLKEISRMDEEMVAHRRRTGAEVAAGMFPALGPLEEYLNPFTKGLDIAPSEWKNRWVSPAGEVLYVHDAKYDPNRDPALNRTDFQRSPVRPRAAQ
ncbi:MAG: hypothetical protein MUC42_08150 [Bryobacter sp.]|nr:hypothetical protein [Bryobacter sp.]